MEELLQVVKMSIQNPSKIQNVDWSKSLNAVFHLADKINKTRQIYTADSREER